MCLFKGENIRIILAVFTIRFYFHPLVFRIFQQYPIWCSYKFNGFMKTESFTKLFVNYYSSKIVDLFIYTYLFARIIFL